MAIARAKKIEIIGLNQDKEILLTLLQRLGIMQLVNMQEINTGINSAGISYEADLLAIEEAISFLAAFKERTGFLAGIANLKPYIYRQELSQVIRSFEWQKLLVELTALRGRFKDLIQRRERLLQRKQLLLPWRKLCIPIDEIQPTKHCGIVLGVLSSRNYKDLLENVTRKNIHCFSEIISQDKANVYLFILYVNNDFQGLEELLKNYHFNFVTLGHHKGTVEDNLLESSSEAMTLDDEMRTVKNKIAQISGEQFKLMMIYDYFANKKKIGEADRNLARQAFTFVLSGWIKSGDAKVLKEEVTLHIKEAAIFISDPKEDEAVPVILENNKLIQPFEFITQIYGMPKYNELDPTPFLAPFFFLYFGLCVSDAGYGLMLCLFSWFVLAKFKMGQQGRKFFKLFLFCGVSTIIIGVLTGSWFGNLIDLLAESQAIFSPLKKFKDSLVVLDPLKEPTKLLGVALSLGIIQVWFGNIVAAIGNIKNRRYWDVVLDQVPMLVFLFGLTGLGLMFLQLFNKAHAGLFRYAALLSALALILTQGRAEKGWGSKLFYGIYNLYNAFSGYLSDVLSYSRLWALGLVTGVMAATINLIAVQFSQILPSVLPFIEKFAFIKIIFSSLVIVVVFIFGHTVSFFMNLLGAFVHPVRLQFVEFFSKFFKPGGNTFRPFRAEAKYINIS